MATCAHITAKDVRVPTAHDRIHKEECTLCFETWDSEDGISVCLNCFNGGCPKHAKLHVDKTHHPIVLTIRRVRKEITGDEKQEPPQKITKVAIGLPGGLAIDSEDKYEYKTSVHCFACDKPLDINANETLKNSVNGVTQARSATKADDVKAWENKLEACEHTLLLQQDPNAPILQAKSLSHCGECELTSGLWLCLTCGHLGCARKNWDGSGGNNHGLEHADKSQHHIVCKMGTITPEGTADIHCYKCDELRLDMNLKEHLARFGINVADQQKTERSIAELELEINTNPELFKGMNEGGAKMKTLFGPGFTGLTNLGNTCYMASILQVMFALPEFQQRYYGDSGEISLDHQSQCNSANPSECYHCQMHKLAYGLMSGKWSTLRPLSEEEKKKAEEAEKNNNNNSNNNSNVQRVELVDKDEQVGIPPRMLKSLICRNHPEFSTMQQQDAYDFFQFLIKTIQQKERTTNRDPSNTFSFGMQQRLECGSCHRVKYSSVRSTELSLPIPLDKAEPALTYKSTDKADDKIKQEQQSKVALDECLNSFIADEVIPGFQCGNCRQTTNAIKNYRLDSFPDTLVVHMRRFEYDGWVPRKLGVQIQVPEVFDLERARGRGKQESEQLLEEGQAQQSQEPQFNEEFIQGLMSMGFPRVRCERALLATGNAGVEPATNWLFEHMDDPDIDKPLEKPKPQSQPQSSSSSDVVISDEMAQSLADMGFTIPQAKKALRETGGNMERAADWLFNHAEELFDITEDTPQQPASVQKSDNNANAPVDNTPPRYELLGFIVHLGTSTTHGHYVAFCKRKDKDTGNTQWAQFNDRKVSESLNPPSGAAYMYFFRKISA